MDGILKYPRTHHLEGSRFQPGDDELDTVPFDALRGRTLAIEEKLDGANAAISFSRDGHLLLQSRGHYLTGGARERHFELFKSWAATHRTALLRLLGSRFVLYGEWLYAKHTIFYDALPHHFLEFDVLDTVERTFLDTPRRHAMLAGSPVRSVPVLARGRVASLAAIERLVTRSVYKSDAWRERLREHAARLGLDVEQTDRETDPSDDAEGLYLKIEDGGAVVGRAKYVRKSFLTTVLDSGSHWSSRPIVPNLLADGVDVFASGHGET